MESAMYTEAVAPDGNGNCADQRKRSSATSLLVLRFVRDQGGVITRNGGRHGEQGCKRGSDNRQAEHCDCDHANQDRADLTGTGVMRAKGCRADIHDGPEHNTLMQDRNADRSMKISCDARPDHTLGPFSTEATATRPPGVDLP